MTNAVVPDDVETDRQPVKRPGGGWVAIVLAAAVVGLLVVAGGADTAPETPDDTLPELEPVMRQAWTRLELPGAETLQGIARRGLDGYVAVGDGPQVWWSADGKSWDLEEMPPGPRQMSDVDVFRRQVVAVGSDPDAADGPRPVIWSKLEGAPWKVVEVATEGPAALEGVTAEVTDVVAWGWRGSPETFDPDVGPLVLTTSDWSEWTELAFPDGFRVRAVRQFINTWYVVGTLTGKPAIFVSQDLKNWDVVPNDGLPFGWEATDLLAGDNLVVNLVDESQGRSRLWAFDQATETWAGLSEPTLNGPVTVRQEALELLGVGFGHLWEGSGEWTQVELAGAVEDVEGNVAVGGLENQPVVWTRGLISGMSAEVSQPPEASWETVAALGKGALSGPWLVGDHWVIGVGTDWWRFAGGGVVSVGDLEGREITRIDRVGDEWVALPEMMWTSDGLDWEERAEPWPRGDVVDEAVATVTDTGAGALAVGLDADRLWSVSASDDGGRQWSSVIDPIPITTIRFVRSVPGGLVAEMALPRNRRQIARSVDGIDWTPGLDGTLVRLAEPPTVVTPEGALFMFDVDQHLPAPVGDVRVVMRGPDGRLAVASPGMLWLEPAGGIIDIQDWIGIPLDPAHGLSAGDVRPLPQEDGVFVVSLDRGSVWVHQWATEP